MKIRRRVNILWFPWYVTLFFYVCYFCCLLPHISLSSFVSMFLFLPRRSIRPGDIASIVFSLYFSFRPSFLPSFPFNWRHQYRQSIRVRERKEWALCVWRAKANSTGPSDLARIRDRKHEDPTTSILVNFSILLASAHCFFHCYHIFTFISMYLYIFECHWRAKTRVPPSRNIQGQ